MNVVLPLSSLFLPPIRVPRRGFAFALQELASHCIASQANMVSLGGVFDWEIGAYPDAGNKVHEYTAVSSSTPIDPRWLHKL